MPPQVNATLTEVREAAVADDWDRPGSQGAVKWAGRISAYYREKVDRTSDGGSVNVDTRRTLWLDTADLDGTGLDTDDLITFTAHGEVVTATAVTVARSALDGVPGFVQTTRVDLNVA